jgi:hypothetical protein
VRLDHLLSKEPSRVGKAGRSCWPVSFVLIFMLPARWVGGVMWVERKTRSRRITQIMQMMQVVRVVCGFGMLLGPEETPAWWWGFLGVAVPGPGRLTHSCALLWVGGCGGGCGGWGCGGVLSVA